MFINNKTYPLCISRSMPQSPSLTISMATLPFSLMFIAESFTFVEITASVVCLQPTETSNNYTDKNVK